jgi:HD-like signal output (HDOD) protein
MHESLRAAMFLRKGPGSDQAKVIWQRSLASACIMRHLSELTGIEREYAFLVGLLHDIGNVVVLRIAFGERLSPRYELDEDIFEYLCHECHQEFGELIADAWSLPPDLKSLISDHHTYPTADDPLRTQRLQLGLADMISALLGYAPYVPYNLLESRVVRDLGLDGRGDFVQLLDRLPDQVDETVSAL